jgi:predicted metal-dependent hydrolase
MDDALRAGVAIYNAGHHHAAHDAWEDRWLDLEAGTTDERFLHGLIQFTAAVYHARDGNWSGATGLAESALGYLADLPADYRGVGVAAVRASLRALRDDPERIERARPLKLTFEGRTLSLGDLDFGSAAVAARVLAAELEPYDETVLARGVEFAREELAGGTRSRFIALVMDFVTDVDRRNLIYQRLREHVQRRERRERDVDDLFD